MKRNEGLRRLDQFKFRSPMPDVLYLTAFAFFLRFYRLGFHSLWLDEVVTVRDASHSFREIPSVLASYPPVWAYIVHLFYLLFGFNDFWLRFPAAMAGALTVPVIYVIAKQFYGDRAAFWAGLLMGVSVFDVIYSQELRMYSLVALEGLLSMYVWTQALETRERRYWIYYGAATLAGLYTHNWFPFLVLSQGLWWLGVSLRDRSWDGSGTLIFFGTGILYVPWLFMLKKQLALPVYGHLHAPGWLDIRETLYAFVGIRVPSGESWVGPGADARFPLLIVSLAFLLWGLIYRDEKRPLAVRTFLVGCFLPVSIAFLISVFAKPIYLAGRYPILGLPAYLLTVSRGFQAIPKRWSKGAACLGGLWIAASLFALGRYYWDYEKSGWKKTCLWISAQTPVPGILYIDDRVQYGTYFIDYYLASRTVDATPARERIKDSSSYLILQDIQVPELSQPIPSGRRVTNEAHFGHLAAYRILK